MSLEQAPTTETTPDIESLKADVERLRIDMESYAGENLTGELLVEADAVAKSLMEAEAALSEAKALEHMEQSKFFVKPPKDYPGNPIIVPRPKQAESTANDDKPLRSGTDTEELAA